MDAVTRLIATNPIRIVSGEGSGLGTIETYTGTRSMWAIQSRLASERTGTDRWARATVFSHTSEQGWPVCRNIETGETC